MFAQGTAGYKAPYESREILDMPTAGVLPLNTYSIKTKLYGYGGIMAESNFCFLKNLMVGMSFGANNIIGTSDIEFQKMPGFYLKYRITDETLKFPAIAVGFNSQGNGKWKKGDNRFENMSPGFYLVTSKNFNWNLGDIAATLGVNYSFEPDKNNNKINIYCGFEQTLGKYFSVCGELNLNLNDAASNNNSLPINFSTSVKSSIARGITLELQLRNLVNENKYIENKIDRRLSIDIIKYF